ncbi:MAG TPA: zinc-ribbon domain-containing protein, partial [Ktedonobacteraceae bacterium]|nr:zinc-ribbon domain-containing protein [Ktedonobacteraceae bacterium]
MICPLCHTQNRDDAKFCKGCGQPLRAESAHSADEVVMVNAVPTSPSSSASAAQAQENVTAPAQEGAQTSNQPPSEPAQAPEAPTPAIEDVANAPTLILTPEKMMAFHSQRWQQEMEQAQNEQAGTASGAEHKDTSLSDKGEGAVPAEQNEQPQQDVADMPTVLMRQSDHENSSSASNTVEADEPIPAPPPPPPSSLPTAQTDSSQTETPVGAGADVDAGRGPSWSPADTSAVDVTNETNDAGEPPASAEESEEPMQASSDTPDQPTDDQQAASNGDFPTLSIGVTLAGRYEITQVVSDDPQEHVYQVVDHQGYQHCWNCGSEQNGDGDEFCIDCGAGLLNVPYLMHEYPTSLASNAGESGTAAPDAHVLQGNIVNTFIEQGHTYAIEQPQTEQNPFPNGVRLLAACDSDAGDVRRSEPNEDSTLVLQLQRVFESAGTPEGVFIVADGLGGHDNGQVASRMTINIIAERMVREL